MREPRPFPVERLKVADHPEWVAGAERVFEEDGLTFCPRMSAPLLELWKPVEGRRIRSRCTAGVRLAMRTDARSVRLDASHGEGARKRYHLDVFVEGRRSCRAGHAAPTAWSGEVFSQAGREMRTLEIWLSHTSETRLEWIEVDAGARMEEVVPRAATWLAIGDSITQGMEATGPSDTYASVAARRAGLGLRNVGVGGEIMLSELGSLCRPLPAQVATVAFGVNDYHQGVPLEVFARRTRGLLEGLLAGRPGFPVGLITPTPCFRRPPPPAVVAPLEEYRRVLAEVVREHPSVLLLEGPELLPPDEKLSADGIHPNDEGMRVYGENLATHLGRLLSRAP